MPLVSILAKSRLALVLTVLSVSACSTAPLTATSPVATPTQALSGKLISPAPTPTTLLEQSTVIVTVKPSADSIHEAVVTDWEELFRTTSRLEYVKANGRPSDKNWWLEQSQRFYAGKALTAQLQHIEQMFSSKSEGVVPGFIEGARYSPQVESCSSDDECTMLIHVQGGKLWSYDLGHKKWIEGGSITEPFDWVFSMQYDSASGHWKVN
jgi:hypothetical protein